MSFLRTNFHLEVRPICYAVRPICDAIYQTDKWMRSRPAKGSTEPTRNHLVPRRKPRRKRRINMSALPPQVRKPCLREVEPSPILSEREAQQQSACQSIFSGMFWSHGVIACLPPKTWNFNEFHSNSYQSEIKVHVFIS